LSYSPGIVHEALHDLEMIRAAGIKGLEPAFELLTSPQVASNLREGEKEV
jgi:hypothetical protein